MNDTINPVEDINKNSGFKFGPIIVIVALVIFVAGGAFLFLNKSSTPTKAITVDEIAKHAVKSDCWMAIEGGVYNVTSFVPKHPGEDAILLGCGKDATAMFNSRPSDGTSHSNRARQTLATFQIGVLAQ